MILHALYDYYERDKKSVREGWMKCDISFLIVLNLDGSFANRIEDRRNDGPFVVPAGQHNNSKTPQLMWDNLLYALDYCVEEKLVMENTYKQLKELESKKVEEQTDEDKDKIKQLRKSKSIIGHEKHLSFVEKCKQTSQRLHNKHVDAVVKFYSSGEEIKKIYEHELWNTMKKKNYNVSFLVIDGNEDIVVATIPELVVNEIPDNPCLGRCLVTGEVGELSKIGTNTPIKGCENSAKLVSFQKNSGYDSYGKEQGYNAPISKVAEFKYSSAFKKLTEFGGKNNVVFVKYNKNTQKYEDSVNRTYIFWAAAHDSMVSDEVESGVKQILNPDRRVDLVKETFKAVWSDRLIANSKDMFYIAGLNGTSGRMALVYWNECTIDELAKNIKIHLENMEIGQPRVSEGPYRGVYQMLMAVSAKDDIFFDCPSSLPDAIVKSIIQGLPYPATLYQACIRKLRASQEDKENHKFKVTRPRVAILKAYINSTTNNDKKLEVMLDENNLNIGYLCGRLFAVLDKIQRVANKQHSIQENYMNSASTTPSVVFPTILKLSEHHMKNLEESGKIFYSKKKEEIFSKIGAEGFPPYIDHLDQGRFFVGYYHQMEALYPSNKETKEQ